MSGLRFEDIAGKASDLLGLTSLTLGEFQDLVPVFEEHYQAHMKQWRLDGKPRTPRRPTTYANSPLPTPEDRLLFILIFVKTNPLQVLHGRLFGLPQCKANQWIHTLLPVLAASLKALGDTPARSMTELAQRLGLETEPSPLFVMTAPNVPLDGRRIPLNKRAVIAARKSAIP